MKLTKEQEKRRDELAHKIPSKLVYNGFISGYNACAADMKDPQGLVDALEHANKIIYDEFSTHNKPGVEVLRQWRSDD